jgi:hypothetical protein
MNGVPWESPLFSKAIDGIIYGFDAATAATELLSTGEEAGDPGNPE